MTYTDYPEADIRTHRWIAKWNRWLAFAVAVGGTAYGSMNEDVVIVAVAIAVAALMLAGALGMRIQALEWELEERTDTGDN